MFEDGIIAEDREGKPWVIFPDGGIYRCSKYAGETKTFYSCATNFGYEPRFEVYQSLQDLRHESHCVEDCGWVKLEVKAVKFSNDLSNHAVMEEMRKDSDETSQEEGSNPGSES